MIFQDNLKSIFQSFSQFPGLLIIFHVHVFSRKFKYRTTSFWLPSSWKSVGNMVNCEIYTTEKVCYIKWLRPSQRYAVLVIFGLILNSSVWDVIFCLRLYNWWVYLTAPKMSLAAELKVSGKFKLKLVPILLPHPIYVRVQFTINFSHVFFMPPSQSVVIQNVSIFIHPFTVERTKQENRPVPFERGSNPFNTGRRVSS